MMCLDGEEKKGEGDVRSHKRRYSFEVQLKGWMVVGLHKRLVEEQNMENFKKMQAYSFEATTPALREFLKGSVCEQSHACRKITPPAIYLREADLPSS